MTDYIDIGQDWINVSGAAVTAGSITVPAGATATYLGKTDVGVEIWELVSDSLANTQNENVTFNNLSDKPTSLAEIDSTANAKLNGFEGGINLSLSALNLALAGSITSLESVKNIASDAVLGSQQDKQKAADVYNDIISRMHALDAQADTFGLTSAKSTCHAAVDVLIAYCATLTNPTLWSDKTEGAITYIDPVIFSARFSTAYSALNVYLNAIVAKASTTSLSYSQPTTPPASKGAVWLDTSATQRVVRTCVDGINWIELAKVITKGSDIGVADGATAGASLGELAVINIALTHRIYQTTNIGSLPIAVPTTTSPANLETIPNWSSTSGSLVSGKTQWQCDGHSDSITGTVTWGAPYLSNLKVDTLESFNINTGRLRSKASGSSGSLLTINAEQAASSTVETHEFRCYNGASLVASMGDSESSSTSAQEEIFRANLTNSVLINADHRITVGYTTSIPIITSSMPANSMYAGFGAFTSGSLGVYSEISSVKNTNSVAGIPDWVYGGYFSQSNTESTTNQKQVYLAIKSPLINAAGYFKWGVNSLSVCTSTYGIDVVGNVNVAGTIYASQNITAFSDRRLKENLIKIAGALDSIDEITGYHFDWKEKKTSDVGIIADEIEKIIPEAVFEHPGGYQVVDYTKIIPLLIEGIKELRLEVKELKRDISG